MPRFAEGGSARFARIRNAFANAPLRGLVGSVGVDALLLAAGIVLVVVIGLWGVVRTGGGIWPVAVLGGALLLAAGAAGMIRSSIVKAREAALDQRLLNRLLDTESDAILVESVDGRTVAVNGAMQSLLSGEGGRPGRKPAAAHLEGWLRDVAPEADLVGRLRGALGDGRDATVIVAPGEGAHAGASSEISVRPLAEGGRVWRVHRLGAGSDGWSARAEAHAAAAAAGLYTLDGAGRFLYLNGTMAEWIGRPVGEVLDAGLRIQDCLVPGESENPLRPGVNMLGIVGGGRTRELQTSQAAVETSSGTMIHGVARPVGPGGAAAQRFQRLFREMPVGVALVDRRLRIGDCNATFRNLVDDERALGRPVIDFVVDEDREAVARDLQSVLDDRASAMSLDVRFRGAGEVSASIFVGRLQDDLANSAGLVLLVIDNTEKNNLEAQLAQSQKMQAVGQLAGGIAHDFNNVLTAMIGFCDLLLQRHRPGDQSFADIMQIKQNANRAAALVRQLLAFSRQQTLQPRLLNVTEVLAELSNLLRRLLGEKVELGMVHGRELGLIKGDQGQLEQVIINLAVNARDAMAGGGRLTIRTQNVDVGRPRQAHGEMMPAGEYVQISIADTGVGIPKENFSRIFEPFFTTKEVGSGTGLGLSTVYGIVKQTGGYLFVDSAGPGEGATFDIYFRRQAQEMAAAEATGSSEIAADLTGGGTVLLVEDEDPVRLFSARALRNKGYKVVEAKTGEAALELLNGGSFDLLVTDMVMPRVDGAQVIREARKAMPDLPVICISGYTEESVLKEVESLDQLRFLSKPFSLKQLAAAVKESIDAAERRRAGPVDA